MRNLALVLMFGLSGFAVGNAFPPLDTAEAVHRPQMYAVFRAHKILPKSLRKLTHRHGKFLFQGMRRGLRVPHGKISDTLIMNETRQITALIDNHRPFKDVVFQMGYVSGLVAVFTNPSAKGSPLVQDGFSFYTNYKLKRFLFVFDEYLPVDRQEQLLRRELAKLPKVTANHTRLLEKNYGRVNGNARFRFNERSAVYGVAGIYFSNLARLSCHLWYYAWAAAHGDLTSTPFLDPENKP